MHPCLQLPEILHILCTSLDNPDLLHAALSCRRFTDPALDVLWHELTSLIPLIHTFTDGVLEMGEDGQHQIRSDRILILEDLDRLRTIYTPRIRRLRLSRVARSDIRPDILRSLANLEIGVLTPNLTHLDWYSECLETDYYVTLFPLVRLFLSPGLKEIGIHVWLHAPEHQEVFAQISSQYSGVEVLKVTWDAWSTMMDGGSSWAKYLLKFTNLKELFIPNLPPDVLSHVASLPNLQDLHLGDIGPDTIPPPMLPPAGAPFAALKGLVMVSDTMERLYGILQRVSPTTPLLNISISHTPGHLSEEDRDYHQGLISKWQTVLQIVRNHSNPDTLTWIDFKDSSYFNPNELIAKFPIRPDTRDELDTIDITPLLQFKNLKTLELSFAHGLWLTKDVLQGIAGAWTAIAFMDLSTNYPPYRHPRVNHEDLVHLVRDCPNLWSLGLNFDATQIPMAPTLLVDKPIRRLLHLKVGNSPIESVGVVSGFLSMHFPRLYKVNTWKVTDAYVAEIGPDFSEEWVEVEKRLQHARATRRVARKEKAIGKGTV